MLPACGRSSSVAIFLGIDGGGSKTSCLIGNETELLGTGSGGPSNVVRVGEARTRESLQAAIKQACASANLPPKEIQRTCVGVAGAARQEISTVLRRLLSEMVAGEIEVVGDTVITLQAAFSDGPGAIVIAGTGSVAYGRAHDGKIIRVGGWGFNISDEGSAHWIGRSAITAALRAEDEGEDVSLLQAVMQFWGLSTNGELVVAANAAPRPDFAALLPLMVSAADTGDPIAREVLTRAAGELARLARLVIDRISGGSESVPVAMSGGVFANCTLVRQVFYNSLMSQYPNLAFTSSVIDPVRGALELARKGVATE